MVSETDSLSPEEEEELYKSALIEAKLRLGGAKRYLAPAAANAALYEYLKKKEEGEQIDHPTAFIRTISRRRAINLGEREKRFYDRVSRDGWKIIEGWEKDSEEENPNFIPDEENVPDKENPDFIQDDLLTYLSGDPGEIVVAIDDNSRLESQIRGAVTLLNSEHMEIFYAKYAPKDDSLTKGLTDREIAEERGGDAANISRKLKEIRKLLRLALRFTCHKRVEGRLQVLIEAFGELAGEDHKNFDQIVLNAVEWVEGHPPSYEKDHVKTMLKYTWKDTRVEGRRASNEQIMKMRIVAAAALYVLEEDDEIPDGMERGFKDDYDVLYAVRRSFGMPAVVIGERTDRSYETFLEGLLSASRSIINSVTESFHSRKKE